MTASVLKEFTDEFRHTGEEIDLATYLMPPRMGAGSLWVYIVNMFLPFIKLKEKDSYYLFCVSTKSKRAYYMHLGYKASELFAKKEFELGEITDLKVEPNPEKFEHKVSFNYRGSAESYQILEYAIGGNWSQEEREQFQTMGKAIVAELRTNAVSAAS